ncbi:MAG: bacteriocin [Desulfobacteraceae bacterium]|nr:MAG: bacteriocin [Desulfobacteraceae bacterium]
MDILRRSISPITTEAWEAIDQQAKKILEAHLSGRKFVDVAGPKGWDYSAEALGRMNLYEDSDVHYGIRRTLPLIEPRVPFEMSLMELDNVNRGARDIDFASLDEAARKIAHFEERAIYHGLERAEIHGLYKASQHDLEFSEDADEILNAVSLALTALLEASVAGPYVMVVNPVQWRALARYAQGYPLRKHLENLITGPIIYASEISDAFLISMRGGDLELVLGQDFSIGYEYHDHLNVKLYITETFTFRILDPSVIVKLTMKK